LRELCIIVSLYFIWIRICFRTLFICFETLFFSFPLSHSTSFASAPGSPLNLPVGISIQIQATNFNQSANNTLYKTYQRVLPGNQESIAVSLVQRSTTRDIGFCFVSFSL
jgi:hypothetical protein